jgi:hypothetical protein
MMAFCLAILFMDFKNVIQKPGIEGGDHVTRICQVHTVHQGLPLLPGERAEFQGSLASCRHDASVTGKQLPISFKKKYWNLLLVMCSTPQYFSSWIEYDFSLISGHFLKENDHATHVC